MDNSSGPAADITGKVMVVGIIVAFLVVVLVLSLHLYARWFWWRVEETTGRGRNRRGRRFAFAVDQDPDAAALRKGLDPSVLRSLPVLVFKSEDFKDGLECAVCLAEVEQGEKARLLPNCKHGFHVECIDMWFQTHATCPLCRSLVAEETLANSPTNVLLGENQSSMEEGPSSESNCPSSPTSTSSRPAGMLIIDIPRHMTENLSSSSPLAEEELRSPMAMRVRSLKRLLSKERRVSPSSSTCVGTEQVERKEPHEDPTKI